MKPASAKAKGRNFQQGVAKAILKTFPKLHPSDVVSTSMGAGGVDIKLSKAARDVFPYAVECKSLKSIAALKFYDQAKAHAKTESLTPLVVMKENGGKPVVMLSLEDFLKVISPK